MTVETTQLDPPYSSLPHSLSSCSSITDIANELPHFASEEEDWQKFGWLLDCGQSFSDILSADPLASEDEAIVFKGRRKSCCYKKTYEAFSAKSRNQSQDIKKSVTEPTSSSAPLVNPAEISLGGDSIEWGKKEIKKEVR